MKKIILLSGLAILVFSGWLLLRQPKPVVIEVNQPPATLQATNVEKTTLAPVASQLASGTNIFVRPNSMDEETWKGFMQYRRMVLEANQPVEFYARVLDQDGRPVAETKVSLRLSRIDEKMFASTNYYEWDAARAVQDNHLDLISDVDGWIKVTEITGKSLWIEAVAKEGYLWTAPQTGSFLYEPGGKRRVGYAGMEDAFDPAKGYTLHLRKD